MIEPAASELPTGTALSMAYRGAATISSQTGLHQVHRDGVALPVLGLVPLAHSQVILADYRSFSGSGKRRRYNPGMLRGFSRFALVGLVLSGCGDAVPQPPAGAESAKAPRPDGIRGEKWSPVREGAPRLTGEQRRVIEELNAIGYADGVRVGPELVRVTRHDAARVEAGLNFYTSGHAAEAYLVDMHGELVHSWSYDYDRLWPELRVPEGARGQNMWRRAHLFPDGSILAMHAGIGMIKLDRDSNLLWEYPQATHHDMDVLPDGTIWTLGREAKLIRRIDRETPRLNDLLLELDADGRELRRLSVLGCLERGGQTELLERMRARDLFHTNSIEVLDGRIAERVPEFAAGNLLISMRHLNAIAVVDPGEREVVWSLTGDFRAQHHPTVLENGNLLLFDNRGQGQASTIYELDPATGETVWTYRGTAADPFFSKSCGTVYRLPAGNTLITESDGGRVFEVTPAGETVWEFFSPHRAGPQAEFIACIFDLQRVPLDPAWLGRSAGDGE